MRYLEGAISLELDTERCNGCGMCVTVCPHAVFELRQEPAARVRRAAVVDRGACMECGACMNNCERGAIRVRTGVGCAAGVIAGWVAGTEPTCGCGDGSSSSCCG